MRGEIKQGAREMLGRGAQVIYEEAQAHKRVGELLKRQRELIVEGQEEDLMRLNEELIEAIGEAHAATHRRRRTLEALKLRLSAPMLAAAWAELRLALRMVKEQARLSEEVAGERLADVRFLLGLLEPVVEGYGKDGRRYGGGQAALLDRAV